MSSLKCRYCGKPIKRGNYCSTEHARLGQQRFQVSKEVLEKLLWLMPTTEIAKIFSVSDKAIEKRANALGIQKPPRGYWAAKYAQGYEIDFAEAYRIAGIQKK